MRAGVPHTSSGDANYHQSRMDDGDVVCINGVTILSRGEKSISAI